MLELPDLTLYVEALQRFAVGRPLERVRLAHPFLLRTAQPPLAEANGKVISEVRRLGKRRAPLERFWEVAVGCDVQAGHGGGIDTGR